MTEQTERLSQRLRASAFQIGLSALPVILALAIISLLIVMVGNNPVEVAEKILEGAFRDSRALTQVVNLWIPLVMVSMGLVVTFTAGLWNIGAEGQMLMGGVFAAWGGLTLQLPAALQISAEIALAMLGGGLWALLVGLLRTRFGVNEIFGGVAFNALAGVFSNYLIAGPWQDSSGTARSTNPLPDFAVLPPISNEFKVSLLMLLIAVSAVMGVMLALRGTRWGLQIRATGKNRRSAHMLGIPTERSMLSALMVCGMLAGVAGAYRVIFIYGDLRPGVVSGGIGFLGLLVVLLVSVRAIWVPLVVFFFATILGGSTRLKIALQLDSSLAGVLQGTLVLMVLMSNGLRQRLQNRRDSKAK